MSKFIEEELELAITTLLEELGNLDAVIRDDMEVLGYVR